MTNRIDATTTTYSVTNYLSDPYAVGGYGGNSSGAGSPISDLLNSALDLVSSNLGLAASLLSPPPTPSPGDASGNYDSPGVYGPGATGLNAVNPSQGAGGLMQSLSQLMQQIVMLLQILQASQNQTNPDGQNVAGGLGGPPGGPLGGGQDTPPPPGGGGGTPTAGSGAGAPTSGGGAAQPAGGGNHPGKTKHHHHHHHHHKHPGVGGAGGSGGAAGAGGVGAPGGAGGATGAGGANGAANGDPVPGGANAGNWPPDGNSQATARTLAERLQQDFPQLTKAQIAGIVGNLYHESNGLQSSVTEYGKPANGPDTGRGWGQWTGERRTEFENYCRANNLDPNSPEGNYEFLVHELKTNHSDAITALEGATSPDQASDIFMNTYEKPADPEADSRRNYTNMVFNLITNGLA